MNCKKKTRRSFLLSSIATLALGICASGCGSESTGRGTTFNGTPPNPNPSGFTVDLALVASSTNSTITITGSPQGGATGESISTVVGWEIDGILRATNGAEPITSQPGGGGLISGIKTNPLVLNVLEYSLGKYIGFTVTGTFVSSAGTQVTVTETFNNVFTTEPALATFTSTITDSALPDRRVITIAPDLQALAALVPPQQVFVKVEQIDASNNAVEIVSTQLGVGDISGVFTVSTTTRIRVTLTTPASGQSLIFPSAVVFEYTQLGVGGSQDISPLPSDIGL